MTLRYVVISLLGPIQFQGESVISSIMLICAVLASLAIGVLLAHGICVAMFAMFRSHARQVAATRTPQLQNQPQTSRLEAMRG
jgi:hypothetical protein